MQYAWFIWSLILLVIWLVLFLSLRGKESQKEMLTVSLWTSLLGLTEPLFVPEYWSPPSLFNLALTTGFDIESLIFAFGVGGIAVVIYERIFRTKHESIGEKEKHSSRHRLHLLALASGPALFFLLVLFSDLNPIYSAFIAMVVGGIATWWCRPDLKKKMFLSALIFLGIYYVYFASLILLYPGYVEAVWNLNIISGILILGVPLEELMFALGFGFYWSSVYEHLMWRRIK